MDQKTLAALRPRDDTSAAIRAAIAACATERAAAEQQQTLALGNRDTALLDPGATAKDIAAFERQAEDAAATLRRLEVIGPDLDRRLADALAAEQAAHHQNAAGEARRAYLAAADAYHAALPGYAAHAEAIAAICRAERDMEAALSAFQVAAEAHLPYPRPVAPPPNPGVPHSSARLAQRVVLPAVPGPKMVWGELPAPHHQPGGAFRYA